ncbi:MAG: ribosome biogenesis factor YjgA [Porticoccus sp.]
MSDDQFSEQFPEDQTPEEEPKSKSALKREMTALQKIGEDLVDLPASQLAKVLMPDLLEDAIMVARRLKNREGKRRQLQYIGKIMRNIDSDAIKQRLDSFNHKSQESRQQLHRLEQWRDRLMTDGDQAIGELLKEYAELDRQHLRQLIRQAQKEASQNKPPAASRKIFKYLQENME